MSKASNQNKRLRKRRSKSPPRASEPVSSRRNTGQTRNRCRRAAWLKKRATAKQASAKPAAKVRRDIPLSQTSLASKPLVRGNLQKVITKNGNHSTISEISREATAGGVIYRFSEAGGLEILLVADHFDRWTIPKGHIEEGETAQEAAIREIGEEAGVHQLDPICWLGKIHFRYRRENILVLMSTQIYLFKALGDTDQIKKEDWMNGIKWFSYDEAVNAIAYRDIAKLIRLGRRRLVQRGELNEQD